MIKFTKGDSVKMIEPGSEIIPRLFDAGWSSDEVKQEIAEAPKVVDSELEALRAEAKELGLFVHHKTGSVKLAEMIKEAKGE